MSATADDFSLLLDHLKTVVDHLPSSGVRVRGAHRRHPALQRPGGGAVGIVLVDLGLPDVHGHELGSRLRELLGEEAVIAAVSGYEQPADRARSKALGFDAHLVKPVEPDRLAAVLRIRSAPTPHPAR